MTNRASSPAYAMLPRSARRVFAAIERAIGDGSSASVSYVDFRLDHHIARKSVSPSLKLLDGEPKIGIGHCCCSVVVSAWR